MNARAGQHHVERRASSGDDTGKKASPHRSRARAALRRGMAGETDRRWPRGRRARTLVGARDSSEGRLRSRLAEFLCLASVFFRAPQTCLEIETGQTYATDATNLQTPHGAATSPDLKHSLHCIRAEITLNSFPTARADRHARKTRKKRQKATTTANRRWTSLWFPEMDW